LLDSWDRFGSLGAPWGSFGAPWGLLGSFWASWGTLGVIWGTLGVILLTPGAQKAPKHYVYSGFGDSAPRLLYNTGPQVIQRDAPVIQYGAPGNTTRRACHTILVPRGGPGSLASQGQWFEVWGYTFNMLRMKVDGVAHLSVRVSCEA